MDPAALEARLEALGTRPAAGEGERQAAVLCHSELVRAGRRPRTQTLWIRRQRSLPRAFYGALGTAASLVAVGSPTVGLGLALGALAALVAETAGIPLVSLLQVRRATQNVIAPPRHSRAGRIRLVLTAAVDSRRTSLFSRLWDLPVFTRAPGPAALLALGLAAMAACAAARLAGAAGSGMGIAQLVPSILVLVLVAGFVDDAFAPLASAAPGAAAAVSLAAVLDARPPDALAVEIVIAGAGAAGAAGMTAYVRGQKRVLAPEEVVVVALGNAGGPLRHLISDGELLPHRLHPRLIALAAALPGTTAMRGRGRSAARVARGARWPAIALEGEARPLAAAALRLVAAIDRELD